MHASDENRQSRKSAVNGHHSLSSSSTSSMEDISVTVALPAVSQPVNLKPKSATPHADAVKAARYELKLVGTNFMFYLWVNDSLWSCGFRKQAVRPEEVK